VVSSWRSGDCKLLIPMGAFVKEDDVSTFKKITLYPLLPRSLMLLSHKPRLIIEQSLTRYPNSFSSNVPHAKETDGQAMLLFQEVVATPRTQMTLRQQSERPLRKLVLIFPAQMPSPLAICHNDLSQVDLILHTSNFIIVC
jgi:hypothetical protein